MLFGKKEIQKEGLQEKEQKALRGMSLRGKGQDGLLPNEEALKEKILVIRHGAFGDMVKALGAFRAICENHEKAHITLLTMPLFEDFCHNTPFFDEILLDPREQHLSAYWHQARLLYQRGFDRVYDLQGSRRTGRYYKLMKAINWVSPNKKMPQWSGNVKGASFYQPYEDKKKIHPFDRYAKQLSIAGLHVSAKDSLSPDLSCFPFLPEVAHPLPERFFMMIPGTSMRTLEKRWPAMSYGEIAHSLDQKGIQTVIVGGIHDRLFGKVISEKCPTALDLTGKTSLLEVLSISQKALGVIGNDTGPLFLASLSEKPTFVLWAEAYVPSHLHAPRGKHIHLIAKQNIQEIETYAVWQRIQDILGFSHV